MEAKVRLMKLKMKAEGSPSVPQVGGSKRSADSNRDMFHLLCCCISSGTGSDTLHPLSDTVDPQLVLIP